MGTEIVKYERTNWVGQNLGHTNKQTNTPTKSVSYLNKMSQFTFICQCEQNAKCTKFNIHEMQHAQYSTCTNCNMHKCNMHKIKYAQNTICTKCNIHRNAICTR